MLRRTSPGLRNGRIKNLWEGAGGGDEPWAGHTYICVGARPSTHGIEAAAVDLTVGVGGEDATWQ